VSRDPRHGAAGLPLAALLLAGLALAGCAAPRQAGRPPPRPAAEPPAARRVEPAEPLVIPPPGPAGPAQPPVGAARPPSGGAAEERASPIPLSAHGGHEEVDVVGVLHVVRRGETVYRIARAYGVSPADLLEANGIADARKVAAGVELFVPGVQTPLQGDEAAPGLPSAGPPEPGTAEPPPEGTRAGGRAPPLAWPVQGILYGRFGVRSGQRHDGIDLAGPEGTPIVAAADGAVIFAGRQRGYGQLLILRHPDGLVTVYAHCSELLAAEGQEVRRGEVIARVGQTGRTTGPHLHFEVRQGTRPRNPLLYLP